MPDAQARRADTAAWLHKAREDLQVARQLLRPAKAFAGPAVFHCQQAAEKALKGFLAWHDVPFRKTHELEEIGRVCVNLDPTLKELVDQATPLTEYAWEFRYPGEPQAPTRKTARAALTLATELYRAVLSRLPKDVKP